MTKLRSVVLMAIAAVIFTTINVSAAGLGQSMIVDGDITIAVISNPHKNFDGQWGYVDSTGEDIAIGWSDEVGIARYVGYFDNEELIFWADGKKKRFYTGHGTNSIEPDRFVINGIKFDIVVEENATIQEVETDAEVVAYGVDHNNCAMNEIDYLPVRFQKLQAFNKGELNAARLIVCGDNIDWSLFQDGMITIEVTINDSCDDTFNISDTVEYFNIPAKNFKGYRLTDYDYPENGVYPSKIRMTRERGVNKHYIYINKVNIHHLTGQVVNVKFRLYQDGELIQAYIGASKVTSLIR